MNKKPDPLENEIDTVHNEEKKGTLYKVDFFCEPFTVCLARERIEVVIIKTKPVKYVSCLESLHFPADETMGSHCLVFRVNYHKENNDTNTLVPFIECIRLMGFGFLLFVFRKHLQFPMSPLPEVEDDEDHVDQLWKAATPATPNHLHESQRPHGSVGRARGDGNRYECSV